MFELSRSKIRGLAVAGVMGLAALFGNAQANENWPQDEVDLDNALNVPEAMRTSAQVVALYKVTPQGSIVINRIPVDSTTDPTAAMKKCNALKTDFEQQESSNATYLCRSEGN